MTPAVELSVYGFLFPCKFQSKTGSVGIPGASVLGTCRQWKLLPLRSCRGSPRTFASLFMCQIICFHYLYLSIFPFILDLENIVIYVSPLRRSKFATVPCIVL